MLTGPVAAWRAGGEVVDVLGHRIFVRRNSGSGPPLVFLHGFPSSSFDFRPLLERYADRAYLTFDFLGYGLSDKPRDIDYTLARQADITTELIARYLPGSPVAIVAHDMGTSVTTELMARDLAGELPFALAGVVLFNGSILLHLATPIVGQKMLRSRLGPLLARLNNKPVFTSQLESVFSDAHRPSAEDLDDQWALATARGGRTLGHKLISYMDERERYAERWHGAVRDWPGKLAFVWALRDRVANATLFDGLCDLRPAAPSFTLPELGHYPQLEDPQAFSEALDAALEAVA